MNLQISFKNIDASDALRGYATEKSDKLKKYFDGKIDVRWTFSVGKHNFNAHCHMTGNNMDYYSDSEASDIYACVDLTVDKIEKQLRKHKEIVTNHLHRHNAASGE